MLFLFLVMLEICVVVLILHSHTQQFKRFLNSPEFKSKMTNEIYDQAKHVITEIKRTTDAVDCLSSQDYVKFGKLMTESHLSLRFVNFAYF